MYPALIISEDRPNDQYKIWVKLSADKIEHTSVDRLDFERCINEVIPFSYATDINEVRRNFRRICDWFILQKQYVPFEEICS